MAGEPSPGDDGKGREAGESSPEDGGKSREADAAEMEPDLNGDWSNFFLLLLLYVMQSVPFGLSSAIPILMQSKKTATYTDQAIFSLSGWPFTFKLLWAPLVDALYVRKFGRRKSWMVPAQYSIGIILLLMANDIDNIIPENGKPNIFVLVYAFSALTFLSATQDIAVDGWALTMLKKNNVGYSSTCNSTGAAIGGLIGSIVPILFTSEDFCNKYLRSTPDVGGILTLKSILYFWGIAFMSLTTLVALFKKENDCTLDNDHVQLNVVQNYTLLYDILKLPSVKILALALVTAKIGFAATDSASILKLIDAGVSKDNIAIIDSTMSGVNMIVPLIIAKYASGPKSMSLYLNTIPFRLSMNVVYAIVIYYTPAMISINGVYNVPMYYYVILIFLILIRQVLQYSMFVTVIAFFSRISDSRFGGTYMTLLNTLANVGNTFPSTISLGMIDLLTYKECSIDSFNDCSTQNLKKTCEQNNGYCIITIDGYYEEMVLCTAIGIGWYFTFRNVIQNLQSKSVSHWMVDVNKSNSKNDNKLV